MNVGIKLSEPPHITAMGIPRHGEYQRFDEYLLPEHWSFHLYRYGATLSIDGVAHRIAPGFISLIPPGVHHRFDYCGSSEHIYAHFSPVDGALAHEFPCVFDARELAVGFDRRLSLAASLYSVDPSFARATVWSVLLESHYLLNQTQLTRRSHPLVYAAKQHIEQQISGKITIPILCQEIGASEGYLSRVFTRYEGISVARYIRSRRAAIALHLIQNSSLPLKGIARTVGVPDLRLFNRMMHEFYECSPRALRARPTQATVSEVGCTP